MRVTRLIYEQFIKSMAIKDFHRELFDSQLSSGFQQLLKISQQFTMVFWHICVSLSPLNLFFSNDTLFLECLFTFRSTFSIHIISFILLILKEREKTYYPFSENGQVRLQKKNQFFECQALSLVLYLHFLTYFPDSPELEISAPFYRSRN